MVTIKTISPLSAARLEIDYVEIGSKPSPRGDTPDLQRISITFDLKLSTIADSDIPLIAALVGLTAKDLIEEVITHERELQKCQVY